MRKVYDSSNTFMIGHLKNILMIEGIPSFTKNEYGSAERIAVNECWYEIWIENDTQYDEAEKLINRGKPPALPGRHPEFDNSGNI